MTHLSNSIVKPTPRVPNLLSQSHHVINCEQLMDVLRDTGENSIDGYLTINGKSFKIGGNDQVSEKNQSIVSVNALNQEVAAM